MKNTKLFSALVIASLIILMSSCGSEDCLSCENSTTSVTTEVCEDDSITFTDIAGNEISWSEFRQDLIDLGECTE